MHVQKNDQFPYSDGRDLVVQKVYEQLICLTYIKYNKFIFF